MSPEESSLLPADSTDSAPAGRTAVLFVFGCGVAILSLLALRGFAARFDAHLAPNLYDPLFNTYLVAWGAHQLGAGVSGWLDAPFYYPERRVLAFADLLPGPAAIAWLLSHLQVGAVASYNLLLLCSFPLAAVGAAALLLRAGFTSGPALLGGLAFAFAPFRWLHLEHMPMLWAPALPWVLLTFDRFLLRLDWQRGAAFVAAYALHLTGGAYLSYMIHLPLLVLTATRRYLLAQMLRRPRKAIVTASIGLAALALLALAFLPYLDAAARGYRRTAGELAIWGATAASFITPSSYSAYAPAGGVPWYRFENALFPGVLAAVALAALLVESGRRALSRARTLGHVPLLAAGLLLAAVALCLADLTTWTGREFVHLGGWPLRIRGYSRPFLILAVGTACVAWAARGCFQRTGKESTPAVLRRALLAQGAVAAALCFPLVYAPLARVVPGMLGMRVPARYGLFVQLAAALSVAVLVERWSRASARYRASAYAAAVVLLTLDVFPRPLPWWRVEAPGERPPVYGVIARLEQPGPVLELPLPRPGEDYRGEIVRMWRSTASWVPIGNGYSGYLPPSYLERRRIFASSPLEDALAHAVREGFRLVVVHRDELAADRRAREDAAWRRLRVRGDVRLLWADDRTQLYALSSAASRRDNAAARRRAGDEL